MTKLSQVQEIKDFTGYFDIIRAHRTGEVKMFQKSQDAFNWI